MKKVFRLAVVAIMLPGLSAGARECAPGQTGFTLLSTQSGFSWRGVRISISSYAHAQKTTSGTRVSRISLSADAVPNYVEETPSLLSEGALRLSSNVWTFSRKFPVTVAGIDAADLTFCDHHQLNLHCGDITGYASEGAVSMRCSLSILEPDKVVGP